MRVISLYLLILYTNISLKQSASFVVPPPTFAEEPQDTWFFNSSSSNLSCVSNQYPDGVSYQWMYEREIVSKFTNFTHIQVEKYGAYTCLLSNSFGTVRSRTALVKKPVIDYQEVKDFHKNIINRGYLFLPSLKVYESVPPVAEVFWKKKTKSQDWEVLQKDLYTKNGSLLIRSVNSEEHNTSFSYIIKQKNGRSVVGYTVTVSIIEISSSLSQCENNSLALIEAPPNVTVYVGQEVSIECLAFFYRCSYPITISWFYNYSNVKNEVSRGNAIFKISNSTLLKSGNYICEAAGYYYIPRVTCVTVLVKPSLNIVPDSVTFYIKNGASITLDTIALTSSVGLKSFEWYFNGKSLCGNSKYNYTSDYKLIVNQPVEYDSGIYQVFYFFDGFELKHAFNAFFVKVPPPTFAEEPQDTWFFNSSSSNLICVANQHPDRVSYQWMYETEIVPMFTNLTHIQVEKYGAYTCLLSNSFGTVRSRTALVKKPVIDYQEVKDFHKNIINRGYLFLPSLKVYESVPPVAEVFWKKKTKPQEWEVLQKDLYTKNGSLLIRSVNSEEHNTSFSYIIKQKNGRSVVGYTVTVSIIEILSSSSQCENNSLALIEAPPNVTVYVGQEISIECLAFFYRCSYPITISWFYNYSNVENEVSRGNAILKISNSTLLHSGNYICEAAGYYYIPRVTCVTVLVKPSLNIVPDSVTFYIKNGASITLNTIALTSSVGLKSFEWYFNGKSLCGDSKYNYTSDYKLIVNQPVEYDSGIYQVFYFFDGFELKHAFNAFFVKVSPPTFAEEPQDTWFFNSSSSNLICVANQHPDRVSYQWMYETEIVPMFTNLTHIQVEKYGAYTCLLSNSFGTVRSRTALVKKPVIDYQEVKDFHKNIINRGYLFLPSLKVYESVPPVAEVFWKKKTKSQDWEVLQKDLYTKNGSLLIRSVNSEEHNTSFSYIIKQKNGRSVVGYTVTVSIIEILSSSSQCENNSLALIEAPPNVTVYVGQEISIECLAFFYRCSYPITISWFYNYSNVENEVSRGNAILKISNSTLLHSGNYICEAAGYYYIPRVTCVTVLVKPSLNVTSESVTTYIKDGAPITLDKIALTSSVGLKSFEWYFNGKSLCGNSKYNCTSDYKLIVNQPVESDSGIYQVFYFFDGFELKYAFNAFFVNDKFITVTKLLTSTSTLSSRVLTTNFRTLSYSTEAVKVSVFSLTKSTCLTISSGQLVAANSSQSLAIILPSLVPKNELIKNGALIISLSVGSAVLVIGLLIGLIMRKRCFIKKATKKKEIKEMEMSEKKAFCLTTSEAECDYVAIQPKPQSLYESYVLRNTSILNSEYISQENPYYE
ncbi:cell adhesion molecule DSCAM-like [Hydra vulgaris]|uniref:Cell adhesion molecule DSCAM-like n=1 Tax=Hydra vulgaris TaxID=6087 RepID=A0ABM4CCE1_HYDVU